MTSVALNPYLHFNDGKAEEALNFYKSVFGSELEISRYGDTPGMPVAEENKNLVMHGVVKTDDLQLMASDTGPMGNVTSGDNVTLSLSGDDDAKLTKYFESLSAGGTINEPMVAAPWGDKFGILTDKFGIHWFVNIVGPKQ